MIVGVIAVVEVVVVGAALMSRSSCSRKTQNKVVALIGKVVMAYCSYHLSYYYSNYYSTTPNLATTSTTATATINTTINTTSLLFISPLCKLPLLFILLPSIFRVRNCLEKKLNTSSLFIYSKNIIR